MNYCLGKVCLLPKLDVFCGQIEIFFIFRILMAPFADIFFIRIEQYIYVSSIK